MHRGIESGVGNPREVITEPKAVELTHQQQRENSAVEREPLPYTQRLVLAGNIFERLRDEIASDPSRIDWLKKWVPGLGPYLYYREGKTGEFPGDKPGETVSLTEKQRAAAYLISGINILAAGASYSGNRTLGWTAVGVAAAVDIGRFAGPDVYKSAAEFYRKSKATAADVMDRMAQLAKDYKGGNEGLIEEE